MRRLLPKAERPDSEEPGRTMKGDGMICEVRRSLKRLIITLRFCGVIITIDVPP